MGRSNVFTARGTACPWALLSLIFLNSLCHQIVSAKISVPDDLHDVVDNEEDQEWKDWGEHRWRPDDSVDLNSMSMEDQMEYMKKTPQPGPGMGFAKLRPEVDRSTEDVQLIVDKWKNLLKTGSIGASIFAVDKNTLVFMLFHGQSVTEVKDFVLSQEEGYEFKIGDQKFRRPGDPSLDELEEKKEAEKASKSKKKKKSSKSTETKAEL